MIEIFGWGVRGRLTGEFPLDAMIENRRREDDEDGEKKYCLGVGFRCACHRTFGVNRIMENSFLSRASHGAHLTKIIDGTVVHVDSSGAAGLSMDLLGCC